MASMLDIGLLDYFVPVFVFILIFVALYALLEKTGFFGKTKGLNAMIAFAIASLFIITPDLMGVIKIMTPWFTILFVFIFMIILMFMFVGIKEESIMSAFSERGTVWIVILISLVVFIYALTQVYGTQVQTIYAGEEVVEDSSITGQVGKIIFHPRVLGVLLLLMIAAQAIRMIVGRE